MTKPYIVGHDGEMVSDMLSYTFLRTLLEMMRYRVNELERIHNELLKGYEDLEKRCDELQRMIDEME